MLIDVSHSISDPVDLVTMRFIIDRNTFHSSLGPVRDLDVSLKVSSRNEKTSVRLSVCPSVPLSLHLSLCAWLIEINARLSLTN